MSAHPSDLSLDVSSDASCGAPAGGDPAAAAARWAAVRALFERLLDLPPAEREPALAEAAVDEAMRAELLSLLAHLPEDDGSAGDGPPAAGGGPSAAPAQAGFLARPAAMLSTAFAATGPAAGGGTGDAPWADAAEADGQDRSGQRLGAWRIAGLLGRGGMGDVWRAHRADGAWDGVAAIKVLRRGMDSQAVLARFAQEQRALARLDHPHIARLLDAGRTPDGLPYFVMEAVDGQPIDRACAGQPLAARLGLFLQLADAVSHAHRQLLLHRDLKPSNVLVDAQGQVKLLDFGIAKALDPLDGPAAAGAADAAEPAASATLLGGRAFTPHYASPEQVRGEPVGTATDIYSLGVLLYVMLTGRRPYGQGATTAAAAARSVLDDAPLRPSATAIAPSAEATDAADTADEAATQALRRQLRGDLDNILLKTLDKDPAQRYPSVDALAADLRAWLGGFPVAARPLGWGRRSLRFVARHRAASAAGALAVAAVLGSTVLAWHQADRAEAQRALAQARMAQVRQLANQLVFKYHDQIAYLPGATRVREALLTDAADFLDRLRQDAAGDTALAVELAGTYYRISKLQGLDPSASVHTGRHAAAEANLDKALALSRGYVGLPSLDMPALTDAVNMQVSQAELRQRAGRMAEADAALRTGLALLDRALARDARDTRALTSAIRLHGVHARILGNQTGLAMLGRWREACASADRSRAAAEATLAADPVNVYVPDSLAYALREQAWCRQLDGRADEALALVQQQIPLRDRMAAKFPDDLDFRWQRALVRAHQAELQSALGLHAQALAGLAQAQALAREAVAADAANVAGQQRWVALALLQARLLAAAGQPAAARPVVEAVLARLPVPAGPVAFAERHPAAEARVWAARLWREAEPARALAWAREAEALMQAAGAGDDNAARRWWQAQAQGEAALALAALGRGTEARAQAVQALLSWGDEASTPPALRASRQAVQALAAAAAGA
ncbi:serine/threonine-protein kinase [Ideonella sp. DXS22W]|uniref:Serine/threonine-protein kinase n=1 Tax=Pseudaquabacterium inlustre TaxID=2984192 RepID=A0ABU9CIY6_9BURK